MDFRVPQPPPPKPAEKQAFENIAKALARKDFTAAKRHIPAALGSTPENLKHLRDAPRLPGLNLTPRQKLDFMVAIVPHADQAMKQELGNDCFKPSSETYGHFWSIIITRSFIQVLLDIASYSADCEEWGEALKNTRRVLELNWGDNNGVRVRVPSYLINLGRPMEALNYCIEWCDSDGNKNNPCNAPVGGFGNLSRHKKEDFSPESTVPLHMNTFGDGEMIYNGALASFLVYGACPFSLSWLKYGYMSNKHILTVLLKDPSTYSTTPDMSPRMMGSMAQANDYIVYCGSSWKKFLEAREWLRTSAQEIAKKRCDWPGCGRVEENLGNFKACGGCKDEFYCGVDCQTRDWKEGGHKAKCKNKREHAAMVNAMGSIGGLPRH